MKDDERNDERHYQYKDKRYGDESFQVNILHKVKNSFDRIGGSEFPIRVLETAVLETAVLETAVLETLFFL